MKIIELTEEEISLLDRTLKGVLSELRDEIVHTDDRMYRDGLKHERDELSKLAARLDKAA